MSTFIVSTAQQLTIDEYLQACMSTTGWLSINDQPRFIGLDGYKCKAEAREPRMWLVSAGEPVALSIEGVTIPTDKGINRAGIGRVSVAM
jgi:hypothetical protein